MKKFIFFVFITFLFSNEVFSKGDDYQDLRTELGKIEEQGSTKASIARMLEIPYSTLYGFITGKTKKSPTVLSGFQAFQAKKEDTRVPIQISETDHASSLLNLKILTAVEYNELETLAAIVKDLPYAPSGLRRANLTGVEKKDKESVIVIPARGYSGNDKSAKGIFFDHVTFQKATSHKTAILIAEGQEHDEKSFLAHLKDYPLTLKHGQEKHGKKVPVISTDEDEQGLLVIPGRLRDQEYDPTRAAHEKKLIRVALRRGQPILALCAGSWRLWDAYRQLVEGPDYICEVSEGLKEVEHHSAARMLSLSKVHGNTIYNTQIHGVSIEKDSLLASALSRKERDQEPANVLPVNSIHWKAVDENTLPVVMTANERKQPLLTISARSVEDNEGIFAKKDGTTRENRHGQDMNPEIGVVEAFEGVAGAPILGLQWHPEGYNEGEENSIYHLNILRFMAEAGEAYYCKRRTLKQLNRFFETFTLV